ncbi:unnamed protein product, partial [Amoebophrya sp. A120]
ILGSANVHKGTAHGIDSFNFHCARYVYRNNLGEAIANTETAVLSGFSEPRNYPLLREMNCGDILAEYNSDYELALRSPHDEDHQPHLESGKSKQAKEEKIAFYGKNEIAIEVPKFLSFLTQEIFDGILLFQLQALWANVFFVNVQVAFVSLPIFLLFAVREAFRNMRNREQIRQVAIAETAAVSVELVEPIGTSCCQQGHGGMDHLVEQKLQRSSCRNVAAAEDTTKMQNKANTSCVVEMNKVESWNKLASTSPGDNKLASPSTNCPTDHDEEDKQDDFGFADDLGKTCNNMDLHVVEFVSSDKGVSCQQQCVDHSDVESSSHGKVFSQPNQTGPSTTVVPADQLIPGDVIAISNGLTLPCDCVLLKGYVVLDESSLTGEAMPIQKFRLDDGTSEEALYLNAVEDGRTDEEKLPGEGPAGDPRLQGRKLFEETSREDTLKEPQGKIQQEVVDMASSTGEIWPSDDGEVDKNATTVVQHDLFRDSCYSMNGSTSSEEEAISRTSSPREEMQKNEPERTNKKSESIRTAPDFPPLEITTNHEFITKWVPNPKLAKKHFLYAGTKVMQAGGSATSTSSGAANTT